MIFDSTRVIIYTIKILSFAFTALAANFYLSMIFTFLVVNNAFPTM